MLTFQNIGLSEEILKALDELGFKEPTPIQAKAIPHVLESDTDLIAVAQTGTGKTAAFSLPVLEKVDASAKDAQVLIISPTRELCMQTAGNIEAFIKYSPGLKVVAAYGGSQIHRQIQALRSGAQIVVGTPGRMLDLIKRRSLKVETVRYVVIDEADELLNMGFQEELDGILEGTPKDKQTLLFSATMPNSVRSMARKYMQNPDQISVGKENAGADKVDHLYYMVHARDRYQALRRIADVTPDIYGIVFCRTRRETQEVADHLIQDHYNAEAIHGELSQQQRSSVMERFRKKNIQILVATDVAARGIDVEDLTHIINYNLPESADAYIHRSGRTGRAQKSGTAISIIHMKEAWKIKNIAKRVGKEFLHAQIPKGSDICKSQLLSLISKIQTIQVDEEQIGPYMPQITEQLENLSREDLIKHFVSAEFNRFLADYKDAPDLNVSARDKPQRVKRDNVDMVKVSLNLGKKDAFGVKRLFSLINQHSQLRGVEIGHIDILGSYSLLDVEQVRLQDFLQCFEGQQFNGKPLEVQLSHEKSHSSFSKRPRPGPGQRGGHKQGFKKRHQGGKKFIGKRR